MQLNRELINQLVPTGLPPESLVTSIDVEAAVRFSTSDVLVRSYLWSQAILRAGLESGVVIPAGFTHFSAGFVSLPLQVPIVSSLPADLSVGGNFSFGGYVLTRSTPGPEQQFQILRIGDRTFPIIAVSGQIELHGSPPSPLSASATCWVKNHSGINPWQTGILSCRHVVAGLTLGASVALTPSASHSQPTSASLAEIDESTIDASVLEIDPAYWPPGLSPLTLISPAAPGQAVEFTGRFTSRKTGTVLRVFHNSGYVGNLFGQRLIIDSHGVAGDSGSLLSDAGGKNGIGIYMGTIPDGSGGKEGIFQDLAQVQNYFGLTLYL
jgi:hypothetical protein